MTEAERERFDVLIDREKLQSGDDYDRAFLSTMEMALIIIKGYDNQDSNHNQLFYLAYLYVQAFANWRTIDIPEWIRLQMYQSFYKTFAEAEEQYTKDGHKLQPGV